MLKGLGKTSPKESQKEERPSTLRRIGDVVDGRGRRLI